MENADIYWGDETGISNCEIVERGFSPKGRPPVLPVETKRQRVNMISAVSSQGNVRFMVYQDTMNQQRLIRFMERLIHGSKRKVFLILDNLKVHHGKLVSAWLKKHTDKIEVFFLPAYAPEYNPDEYWQISTNDFRTVEGWGYRSAVRSRLSPPQGYEKKACFRKKASLFPCKSFVVDNCMILPPLFYTQPTRSLVLSTYSLLAVQYGNSDLSQFC